MEILMLPLRMFAVKITERNWTPMTFRHF